MKALTHPAVLLTIGILAGYMLSNRLASIPGISSLPKL